MDRLRTTGEDLRDASRKDFAEYWGHDVDNFGLVQRSGWVDIEDVMDPTMPNPEEAMLIKEAEAGAEVREEAERIINALSGKINDSVVDVVEEEESTDAEILEYTGSPKHSGMIVGSRRAVQSKMF